MMNQARRSREAALRPLWPVLGMALLASGVLGAYAQDNSLREFFPYGVYAHGGNPEVVPPADGEGMQDVMDRVCKDLADHHMNCVWTCNLAFGTLPVWLEAGRKHGVRIVPQSGGPPAFVRPGWFKDKEDFARRVEPFYQDMAEKHRDDPALLAWSVTEENPPVPWFLEAVADLTLKMAEWDPKHPMISMDNRAPSAWMNAQVVKPKSITRDLYVFFTDGLNGPYNAIGARSALTRECIRFRTAADSCGAVFWFIGQGMSIVNYGNGRHQSMYRYPTPEEIRWQVWATIQQGAKGFFYFMYVGRRGDPTPDFKGEYIEGLRDRNGEETPQFRMAAQVGEEIAPLTPVLLELDIAPPHREVIYWENTPVSGQTFVHRKTGKRFLIVVNHDCNNIQPIGIELGYWPRLLDKEESLFDLRSGQKRDYQTLKLATLLPGDGTVFFVGTADEWGAFAQDFYAR